MDESISEEQLGKIYEDNFERIYRFFYVKISHKENAQELTSEVFLALAEKLRKGDVEIESAKSYLYGIARIIFTKFLSRKYTEVTMSDEQMDYIDHFDQVVDVSRSESKFTKYVKQFIDKLPRKQQLVLRLRLIEKLSLELIAEQLGKNMNYVKTTQKRGIANLKKYLAQEGF